MSVGHSPHVPQFTPDMAKDQNEVTEEEKEKANRRIAGGGTDAANPASNIS
jgi:phosphatidylserine decarboxylase